MIPKAAWQVERNWSNPGQPPRWSSSSIAPEAWDAASAVEEWARQYDSDGDYTIISGAEVHVRVRASDADPWQEFTVVGESEPVYRASEFEGNSALHGFAAPQQSQEKP